MRILVLGANGFIGARICDALDAAGHEVRRGMRPEFDFARDREASAWQGRLQGLDVLVNAVGLFREEGTQTFDAVHVRGPLALFEACAALGIAVIQLSALGADEGARSGFHRSKKAADDALLALPVPSLVLQPSLVYGEGGASAGLFAMMATLPAIPLPGGGQQRIQPVHVDDLAAAVVAAIERRAYTRERIAIVGPSPVSLREYLAVLRAGLGLPRAWFVPLPMALMRIAAKLRLGLLDADALEMLERGNVADAGPLTALLGHPPRAPAAFVDRERRRTLRRAASLDWLLPVLRVSIALVWITAGVVSLGLYPVEDSLELLARTGITGSLAYVALYGAAALDLALGVATLALKRRRLLWAAQAAVILAYTAIITVFLPEQWLHPYGPVVKNLPLLAAILLLHQLERR